MEQSKTDRRIRRTKARLLQSLMTLMQDKDIRDISVKELSDLADINRGTFYLHYKDVYDMLNQLEDELFREFNVLLDRNMGPMGKNTLSSFLDDIFLFLYHNRMLGRILTGPHGDLAFVNRMKALVWERLSSLWAGVSVPSENIDYYFTFLTSGCIGMIQEWLNRDEPESPEEIARITESLISRGISPVFPLAPPDKS